MNLKFTNKHLYIKVLLLVSLLFSFSGHSHEYPNDAISIDKSDCKLCQYNVITPTPKLELLPVNVGHYYQPLSLDYIVDTKVTRFYFALQRAPPISR
jgi:hypothetical protein